MRDDGKSVRGSNRVVGPVVLSGRHVELLCLCGSANVDDEWRRLKVYQKRFLLGRALVESLRARFILDHSWEQLETSSMPIPFYIVVQVICVPFYWKRALKQSWGQFISCLLRALVL